MSANLGASRSQESLRVRFQKAFGRTAIPWFDDHSAFLIFRRPEDVTVRYWFFEPTIDYTQPFHPDMSRAIGKYMLAASRVRTATVENDRTPEEFALLIKDYGSSRVHLKSFLDPTKDVGSALDQFDSSHCTHMAMASLSIKIRELPEAIRSSAPSEEQAREIREASEPYGACGLWRDWTALEANGTLPCDPIGKREAGEILPDHLALGTHPTGAWRIVSAPTSTARSSGGQPLDTGQASVGHSEVLR